MRKSRFLTGIVAMLLMALVFTACSKKEKETVQPTESSEESVAVESIKNPTQDVTHWQAYTKEQCATEDVSKKAIAYQFNSNYSNDNKNLSLLINLYEDGFLRIFQCNEDGSIVYSYNGYWTNQQDQNLYFAVLNYVYEGQDVPKYNIKHGAIATVDYAYTLEKIDEAFSFTYNLCLGFKDGGQYVRSTEISGATGEVEYNTIQDFSDATAKYWGGQKATSTKEETSEAKEATADETALPVNTMYFTYVADVSAKLTDKFTCESSVWGNALGSSGNYETTDSKDILFSWTGKFCTLDFLADGTYVFNFKANDITETGTWTFKNWSMTVKTAGGKEFAVEMSK